MKLPKNLLARGIASIAIGAAVLTAPAFVRSADLRLAITHAEWVGWLAIAVGFILIAIDYLRRRR